MTSESQVPADAIGARRQRGGAIMVQFGRGVDEAHATARFIRQHTMDACIYHPSLFWYALMKPAVRPMILCRRHITYITPIQPLAPTRRTHVCPRPPESPRLLACSISSSLHRRYQSHIADIQNFLVSYHRHSRQALHCLGWYTRKRNGPGRR